MTDSKMPPKIPKVEVQRRKSRSGLGTVFSLVVAGIVFGVLFLSLSGRTVAVPEFLRASIEDRVNAQSAGSPLALGDIRFAIGRNGVPRVVLNDVRVIDPAGGGVAQLNSVSADLALDRLFRGEVAASNLVLSGAQITLRRTADGSFALRSDQLSETPATSLPEILESIDRVLASSAMSSLGGVLASGVVLTLEDARSGRIWQATNATALVRKTEEVLSVSITSDVFNGTDSVAEIQVSVSRSSVSGNLAVGAQLADMPAADIALQSPALSWLSVLDAPLSGAVRAEMDATGALESFAGTFDMSKGALRPSEDTPPVEFETAQAYFDFYPALQRIDFSQVSFAGTDLSVKATGHSYLSELDGPWPQAFLGQFRVDQLDYSGGDLFSAPVSFTDIRADMRLRLDPFTAEIAQLVIDNQGTPVRASGRIAAGEGGWTAAIDASTKELDTDRVLELWPLSVSPITRGWLAQNLKEGTVRRPSAAVRYETGAKPDISLSFEFEGGRAKFLPDMPELTAIAGRATMLDHRFTLSIEEGGATASTGDWIDASGSVFEVEDVRPKPTRAKIAVAAKAPLTAALTLLNNRPLRVMERAGRNPDLADAWAEADAVIRLPLVRDIPDKEVTYDVVARLSEVVSDRLIEGRVLSSPQLNVKANQDGISVDGNLRLDGVPVFANWEQPFRKGAEGVVTGQVALSPETVAAFDVDLPRGLLNGSAAADFKLALPAEGAAELELTSNLAGLGLSVPSLNWQKGRRATGALSTRVILTEVPDVQAFSIDAAGLSLDGTLDFSANGFRSATFREAKIEDWLDSSVRLVPQANGTNVTVQGGVFDLRRFESGGSSGSSGRDAGIIDLNLDRLIVTDGIVLRPIQGQLRQTADGLEGEFQARVNGGTPIQGRLTPANGGTAVRISSGDAAGVIRDAGLTPNGQFGNLDLVLTPVADAAAGHYDGQFLIENMRLRKAPLMADLLDAISVVGLIDQLDGPGIKFTNIDGRFRLTPRRLQVLEAAAVGPSIGISADGNYDIARKKLDIRGVISPVYFLNGIGSIFSRRGEGLFGFNYRLSGGTNDPRIGVNPLSILTPGMFRRMFRAAPPEG